MSRSRFVAAIGLLLAVLAGGLAAGAAPVTSHAGMPMTIAAPNGVMPLAVHHAGHATADAYAAALAAPEVLTVVPCTCGCDALGHRNNLDCYIDHVHRDGTVVFSTHGLNCAVCQAITRDALAGAAAGMDARQLHTMIVARFGGTR